jgi:hypothetical protein
MMKHISLFLAGFLFSCTLFAQRTIQMRNIWTRPQVHVLFEGYTISFTIKDINKALVLLAATGDSTYGTTSGLDTAKTYNYELYPGTHMQFKDPMQELLQKGVAAFLLTAGHAYIESPMHRQVSAVIADIQPFPGGVEQAYILFYDPANKKMLFTGMMASAMYNQDLGID